MMKLNPLSQCEYCKCDLWNNDEIAYCSNCRIVFDSGEQYFEETICIICGNKLHEHDVPIILFSNPQKTFDESCFKQLVNDGVITLSTINQNEK